MDVSNEIDKYLKAAHIVRSVLKKAKFEVKEGRKIASVVDALEREIAILGGMPAFPLNLSINDDAAHNTAGIDDDRIIPEKAVVKIDCGVHIDGFIADAAITIDLSGEYGKLHEAAEAALSAAVAVIRDGIKISEIGRVVEEKIKCAGFKPISNLTGHTMRQWKLHAGVEIPNCYVKSEKVLREGDVVAIEPFVTNGMGYVVESGRCEIYSEVAKRLPRTKLARELFEEIEKFRGLPFAQRWIVKKFEHRAAFQEVLKSSALKSYPVLRESAGGIVAQAEHTAIVEKDSAKVIV